MKHAFLFGAAAAAILVASSMAADIGKLPSVNTKSTRTETPNIPMVAPEGFNASSYFKQMPVFSTNGITNSGLSKLLRAEGEEETTPEI